jgi:hypothetical protein
LGSDVSANLTQGKAVEHMMKGRGKESYHACAQKRDFRGLGAQSGRGFRFARSIR